ncbi:MAG: hypothetical protein DRO40_06780 [Thermoprotei archaeon]|nr:MAG: hypothetical protein DRO40_06780 [Thermoprotei archaeon]
MITYKIIEFTTPVHIGDRGIGVEAHTPIVSSTTLYSALVAALTSLGVRIDLNEPVIIPSSLIPVISISDREHLLLWLRGLHIILSNGLSKLKAMVNKKISLLDYSRAYETLRRVCLVDRSFLDIKDPSECTINIIDYDNVRVIELVCDNKTFYVVEAIPFGKALIESKLEKIPKEIILAFNERRIRNVVDRITQSTTPYYLGLTRYITRTVFLYDINTNIVSLKDVNAALRLLGDIGLGGERTYGFGQFKVLDKRVDEVQKLTNYIRRSNREYEYTVVQGLYSPSKEELTKSILPRSIYTCIFHGGRSGLTGFPRSLVLTLQEGSIVHIVEKKFIDGFEIPVIGKIVRDVIESDIVVRSFSPFHIPLVSLKGDLYGC